LESKNNPPKVNLVLEKKHSELIRNLIANNIINACHDVSDGGILIALFEMCLINNRPGSKSLGCKIENSFLDNLLDKNALLFGEDQARYIISASAYNVDLLINMASDIGVDLFRIGEVVADKIIVGNDYVFVQDLQIINEKLFDQRFS
jgi:phosphoribosylformylglycinamidine synthase